MSIVGEDYVLKNVSKLAKDSKISLKLERMRHGVDFSANGKFLAFYGQEGNVSAINWQQKKAMFSVDVNERVHDVKWLHNENMLAVAQDKHVYIYDQQGVEIHRLRGHSDVRHLEFLKHHFLLASWAKNNFLRFLDISTGSLANEYNVLTGHCKVLRQDMQSSLLYAAQSSGSVTCWSPQYKKYVAKICCHKGPVNALAIDKRGTKIITSGSDGTIKIFDTRNYAHELTCYNLPGVSQLDISQTGFLSVCRNNTMTVFNNFEDPSHSSVLMRAEFPSVLNESAFCPYHDTVVTASHDSIETYIVPGAGFSEYDSFEENACETKKQRIESELKGLMDKLPFIVKTRPSKSKNSPNK